MNVFLITVESSLQFSSWDVLRFSYEDDRSREKLFSSKRV